MADFDWKNIMVFGAGDDSGCLRQKDVEKIIIKTENIGAFVTSTLHD